MNGSQPVMCDVPGCGRQSRAFIEVTTGYMQGVGIVRFLCRRHAQAVLDLSAFAA